MMRISERRGSVAGIEAYLPKSASSCEFATKTLVSPGDHERGKGGATLYHTRGQVVSKRQALIL